MFFSVVIPTYNRSETLVMVLDALQAQTYAPDFEIIVINDGSSDETESVISQYENIIYRKQPNSGPATARNYGISLAKGKYIVFIGDDTVPDKNFLAEHYRIHTQFNDPLTGCLGYTGWPAEYSDSPFMNYINDYGLQFGYKLIKTGQQVPYNFFYTSNISVSAALLKQNLFDTSFPGAAWEDIELSRRLHNIGLKIIYNDKAITNHYHKISIDSFSKRQYFCGKTGVILFKKHPEFADVVALDQVKKFKALSPFKLKYIYYRILLGEKIPIFQKSKLLMKYFQHFYFKGLQDGLKQM
ncbi:glycosyltransferase family 2 protein [soil metagenome]